MVLCRIDMARSSRNDAAIADALTVMTHVLAQANE